MALTALPTPPSRSMQPAVFVSAADLFLAALPTFVSQVNALETNVNAQSAAAVAAAASASASAAAALASASATLFNAATNYAIGAAAVSAVNFTTYRNTAGGVNATDPGLDATGRWVPAMPRDLIINVIVDTTMSEGPIYTATVACNLSLPLNPVNGMTIRCRKTTASLVTVLHNGQNINGTTDDRFLGSIGTLYSWMWVDAANGWILLTD